MKERPILFSAPMVLALQDGRKTQTRRLKGLEQINQEPDRWHVEQEGVITLPGSPYSGKRGVLFGVTAGNRVFAPALYAPDTVLWTREAWRLPEFLDQENGASLALRYALAKTDLRTCPIQYEADLARRNWPALHEPGRYRHARFMPRWAARIERRYLGERTERLQDISEADAWAEGVQVNSNDFPLTKEVTGEPMVVTAYRKLWESLNGAGSWNANPWVRVIEFKGVAAHELQQVSHRGE